MVSECAHGAFLRNQSGAAVLGGDVCLAGFEALTISSLCGDQHGDCIVVPDKGAEVLLRHGNAAQNTR